VHPCPDYDRSPSDRLVRGRSRWPLGEDIEESIPRRAPRNEGTLTLVERAVEGASEMVWEVAKDGLNPSEGGVVVRGEVHPYGARICLEKGCESAPWAITCGIYSRLMHTTFCGDETIARERYDEMKMELVRIMELNDDEASVRSIEEFVDRYS